MTGKQVLQKAKVLFGQAADASAIGGISDSDSAAFGLEAVGQIYGELHFIETGTMPEGFTCLDDELALSDYAAAAAAWGVASLLAFGEGDGEKQSYFTAVYSRKCSCLRAPESERADDIPTAD